MAPPFGAHGAREQANHRQGSGGLPRGARVSRQGGVVNARVERLRSKLEEPLLVSNPTNVLYLTGFHSSNPALLVEPDRLRLFSDFRYREAGNAIEGVEFMETR